MTRTVMAPKQKARTKQLVYAYGFDVLGFPDPRQALEIAEATIEFVSYADQRSLDGADGVIVPQGIFESIGQTEYTFGSAYTKVTHDEARMVERERQLWNLIRNGGWAGFPVRRIRDAVPPHHSITATDLCKRVLNVIGVEREPLPSPISLVLPKRDEFKAYVERFGVAQTTFRETYGVSTRTLAVGGQARVGIESGARFFFLPFHTTSTNIDTFHEVVTLIARGVISYRLKMQADLPDWVDKAVEFGKERALRQKVVTLEAELAHLSQEIEEWRGYKKILATSHDALKDAVVTLLEKFFGFKVDPQDEGKEDFKILVGQADKQTTAAVGEAKGVNASVKREYVTQVDTHRERSDLPSTVPGLLVINTHMDVNSLDQRAKHPVAGEQIKLAKALNVLIVRAVDLLKLMQQLETRPRSWLKVHGTP